MKNSNEGGVAEVQQKVHKEFKEFELRSIQRGFIRSYSRNHLGVLDNTLVPAAFTELYLDEASDASDFDPYIESYCRKIIKTLRPARIMKETLRRLSKSYRI